MIEDCHCFCGTNPFPGLGLTASTFPADGNRPDFDFSLFTAALNCQRDASSLPPALFSFTLRAERWLPALYQTYLPAADICLYPVMPVFLELILSKKHLKSL